MQEMMTSVESLTVNATIHLSGCGIQLMSKKGVLTRTPAVHLLATHAGESSTRFTLSSSSSSSSSIQDVSTMSPPQPPQREILPHRRPLKLTPLDLPKEVREAQRQKMKSGEMSPRKSKVCWSDTPARSPERYPFSIVTEPHKPQHRPVNQLKLSSDRSARGEEEGRVEGNPTVNTKSHLLSLCQNRQTQIYPACAPENSQSAAPYKNQDAVKRRLMLRRSNRLEEDQSKSSSSASADEGTIASAGPGKGQCSAKRCWPCAGKDIMRQPAGAWGF